MRRFSKDVLLPYISASRYSRLCEVGSAVGDNIDRLLADPRMHVCCVDAGVQADLVQKYAGNPRVRVIRGLSLDVMTTVEGPFDCIMIDGDHNWYTVFHELTLIHARRLLAENGTIFLHDVCWPYARRDMYFNLDTVPAEFRQPVQKRGIVRGVAALSEDESRGMNGHHWNAVYEGGPRNGVLTAVEDFLREQPGYRFFSFHREWGLGVLVRASDNRSVLNQLRRKARMSNAAELLKSAMKTVTARQDVSH